MEVKETSANYLFKEFVFSKDELADLLLRRLDSEYKYNRSSAIEEKIRLYEDEEGNIVLSVTALIPF